MRVRRVLPLVAALSAAACGPESAAPVPTHSNDAGAPAACAAGEMPLDGGGCQPAGLPPEPAPCAPGERTNGRACIAAGIAPDACAAGFMPDDDAGCDVVLADSCAAGTLAVPGEATCHAIASCGMGTWGDIPVDASTEYVDGSYAATDSDGTAARPWTTIAKAIDVAAPGALIAVAAGSYDAAVVFGKPVRLWGRCPQLVELRSSAASMIPAAVAIAGKAASGTEVHAVAIGGDANGIIVTGATALVFDHVWIHDIGQDGVSLDDTLAAASATITDSLVEASVLSNVRLTGQGVSLSTSRTVLRGAAGSGPWAAGAAIDGGATLNVASSVVEQNGGIGLYVAGASASVDASVVRDTLPAPDGTLGRGIVVLDDAGTRGSIRVTRSVLERNRDVGISIGSSDATLETTVVRDTQPTAKDQTGGEGIAVGRGDLGGGTLSLVACKAASNHGAGILVQGGQATLAGAVVVDTQPAPGTTDSVTVGVEIKPDTERSKVAVSGARIERSSNIGIDVIGSDVVVDSTIVRDNGLAPGAPHARGIDVQANATTGDRSILALTRSLLDRNHRNGIRVAGSDALIESTTIRATQSATDTTASAGIVAQTAPMLGTPSKITVRTCVLDENGSQGIAVFGSDLTLEATVIENGLPFASGIFGFGAYFIDDASLPATANVRWSVFDKNAGVGIFAAGSVVSLEASVVRATATLPDGTRGRGVQVQDGNDPSLRGALTVTACELVDNREFGVVATNADATLDHTTVRGTRAFEGQFGDGAVVVNEGMPATLTVLGATIAMNERAGITNYGGKLTLGDTTLDCNPIQLDGDANGAAMSTYDDQGGNVCTCGATTLACAVDNVELDPPMPLTPAQQGGS